MDIFEVLKKSFAEKTKEKDLAKESLEKWLEEHKSDLVSLIVKKIDNIDKIKDIPNCIRARLKSLFSIV